AEDVGDLLLVRGTVEHLALMTVGDAQHLLAVILVAAALLPEIGGLDRRHQDLFRPRAGLLLADDLLDLLQDAQAERQPGIDAGARLPDHAGAQHEAVRDDLRLAGIFLENGQKIGGQAHGSSRRYVALRQTPAQPSHAPRAR